MFDIKLLGSAKGEIYGDFNDISFDANGDVNVISGADRIKQDIVKILITVSGNLPYVNYGTFLSKLVNSRYSDEKLLSSVNDEVISAIQYLVSNEESIDGDEIIDEITTLEVSFEEREVLIDLVVTTLARKELNLEITL